MVTALHGNQSYADYRLPVDDEEIDLDAILDEYSSCDVLLEEIDLDAILAEALQGYLPSPHYTWLLDDDQIALVQETESLFFESEKWGRQPIDLGGHSCQEGIQLLSQCHIERRDNTWVPLFFEYCEKWPAECQLSGMPDLSLSLVKRGKEKIWHLFDQKRKTITWLKANPQQRELAFYLKHAPRDSQELETYWQDYWVDLKIENEKLLKVTPLLRHSYSILDPSVKIDRDHYGVTLIVGGRSTGKTIPLIGSFIEQGHAMLAIDRIKRGRQELLFAHIKEISWGYAKAEILEGCSVYAQSETWTCAAERCEALIERILKSNQPILYNMTGNELFDWRAWSTPKGFLYLAAESSFYLIDLYVLFKYPLEYQRSSPIPINNSQPIYNCLSWVLFCLKELNIHLPYPEGLYASPHLYIDELNRSKEK